MMKTGSKHSPGMQHIPKDSPMLEAVAERKLVEKLKGLGYMMPIAGEANTSTAQ